MSEAGKKVAVIDQETGKPQELDPIAAQEAFVSGRANLPAGADVSLVKGDTVRTFPAERVQEAMQSGWSMANRDQVLTYEAQKQGTQAALEGVAAGLTGGLSDLALVKGFGVEGVGQRRETSAGGLFEALGTVGGIAGTIATGGAAGAAEGAAAAGARATAKTAAGRLAGTAADIALAPTRALTAMGNAAEAAAGRAATALGASGTASRLAAQAIGRGVEGATVGAIGSMSEEAMGNPEANAAQLLAAGGMGALTGGLFGAGAGVAMQGLAEGLGKLGRGKPGLVTATADDVGRSLEAAGIPNADKGLLGKFADYLTEKAKGVVKTAYETGNKAAVSVLGHSAEDVALVNSAKYQEFYRAGEKATIEAADKLGSVIDDITKHARVAEKHLPARPDTAVLAREMPVEMATEAVSAIGARVDDFRAAMRSVRDNEELLGLGAGGAKRVFGKAEQAIDEMESRVFKMVGAEREYATTATRKGALGEDVVTPATRQRSLTDVAGLYEVTPAAAAEGYASLTQALDVLRNIRTTNKAVAAEAKAMGDNILATLQDTSVFGKLAETTTALNRAREARDGALSLMKGKLRFDEKSGAVDRGSLLSYVKGLSRMDSEDAAAVNAIHTWITAQQDVVANTAKLAADRSAIAGEIAAVGSPAAIAEKFAAAHTDLSERVTAFNTLDRLSKAHTDQLGMGSGPVGYAAFGLLHTAAGMLGAGPVGHVLTGVATQAALDPARAAVLRARSGATIDAARKLFAEKMHAVMGLPSKALPTTGPRVANLARTTSRLFDAKTDSDRRTAFRERLDEVAKMNTAEHAMERNKRVMASGEHMPKTAAAMDAKAQLAALILMNSVPAPRRTPGGIQTRAPSYSDDAIRRFMRIDRAVQDPLGVLERAADGSMTHEDVQVWHTVFPELRDAAQAHVMDALAAGHELPRHSEESLLRLLQPNPAERADHLQRLQALHTPPQAPPPPRPTPAQNQRQFNAGLSPAGRLDAP